VEYTLMLLGVHAIWVSASAPTAEHQRRRSRTPGDRAGKQNRQFIGALAAISSQASAMPLSARLISRTRA
jgi:hypothetical protein